MKNQKFLLTTVVGILLIAIGGCTSPETKEPVNIDTPAKTTEPISYTKNDDLFSVTTKEFKVSDTFKASALYENHKRECPELSQFEKYYQDLLSSYSDTDTGTKYTFTYEKEQNKDPWFVTVIPNKIGYTDVEKFKNDFASCGAGVAYGPSLISSKYLVFYSGCGELFDLELIKGIGCSEVRKAVEPTIKVTGDGEIISYANWKTYEYTSFTIPYPSGWNESKTTDSLEQLTATKDNVKITIHYATSGLEDWYKSPSATVNVGQDKLPMKKFILTDSSGKPWFIAYESDYILFRMETTDNTALTSADLEGFQYMANNLKLLN